MNSSQKIDDFVAFCLWKCFQSLRGDISQCISREGELRTSFIDRELRNKNGIIVCDEDDRLTFEGQALHLANQSTPARLGQTK